ncbi:MULTISPECIES: hypothetical protein [Paenibacillus]|uniref:hypothetical protein n=1 Tax=Paenibacillus TaxID=44249 RepID=UPI0004647A6D|nr:MULTISPECIES: hypothetical protein [Paenibacillus]KGP81129.1 hypothetical protein P364_0117710 [Paenibacillus sp. MAEPY2]KGP86161.1 hypothetical protein P363_0119000 [Paenibacillus sp. MAEPY1]OZQ71038.1 hypothetical protein CA599_10900 [Paenibacillus taichungensis]
MVEGILLYLAWVGLIIGVAIVASGLTNGTNGKDKFDWSATIHPVSWGLFMLIVSIYWIVSKG